MEYKIINKNTKASCRCRMCGQSGNLQFAEVESLGEKLPALQLFKCLNCGSFNFSGENPVMGYQDEEFSRDYWKHYVQFGAGIYEMLEPLFMLGDRFKGELLDVGCGFGFVVDFVNSLGIGRAIGLESADYGAIGAKLLEIPIYNSLYNDSKELKGKKFDIVYSCEVIEHVEDPSQFVNEIVSALKEDGILVLTTPSADGVQEGRNPTDVIATLSPYFHYFISSKKALENLLSRSGFEHVYVIDSGTRLMAWASQKSLPEIECKPFRDLYFSYLKRLGRHSDINVSSGAKQRILRDLWRDGDIISAETMLHEIEIQAFNEYGASVINPNFSLIRGDQIAVKGSRNWPIWYGSVLYYSALLAGTQENNNQTKAALLEMSIVVLEEQVKATKFSQYVQECHQLLPHARKERILAHAKTILQFLKLEDRSGNQETLALLQIKLLLIKTLVRIAYVLNKTSVACIGINRLKGDIKWWRKNWKKRLVF